MAIKKSIKKINNNSYLYISDYIYIAPGVGKLKNKSLGRVESLSALPKEEIDNFKQLLSTQEIEERTKYWSKKVKNNAVKNHIGVGRLEKLRTELYRSKGNIGSIGSSLMETAFIVDFIFNSNRIEGSKLPREQVKEIIISKTKKGNEVTNSMRAINYINSKFKWNKRQILYLHKIMLEHEPSKLGFRRGPIIVGNYETLRWAEITKELDKLLVWYKENKHKIYPPELAFEFYYRFERIHPFNDGNGRIGRLLMNRILKENRYHPIIIWNRSRTSHMNSFGKYMEGKPAKYFSFMSNQMIKTYKIYIGKLKDALDIDKQTKAFMKPTE